MKRLAATIGLVLAAWGVSTAQTQRVSPALDSTDPVVRAYASAHLSRIAHSTGNLVLEQLLLRRVILDGPDAIASGARHRLAENAIETGNYSEAIRLLTASGTAPVSNISDAQIRNDRAILADAYRLAGDNAKALAILNDLLARTPNPEQPDDADLAAVRSLDAIDGGSDLGDAQHLRRANVYQFNRYWVEARRHFEVIQTPPFAADAMFQISRGYSQSLGFVEAITWYERVIEQFPDTSAGKDALLQLASAYARVGKTKEAFSRYQAFIDKYPLDEKVDRAYLNIVDIRRDLGDDSEAIKWCGKTEDAFRGKRAEAQAVFAEARIYASKEEWSNAIAALDRLKQMPDVGGATVPGGTTQAEVAFMRAYALERLGRKDDAVSGYLAIADGRAEYYGWRATERLGELGVSRPKLERIKLPPLPPLAHESPLSAVASRLSDIGLFEESAIESEDKGPSSLLLKANKADRIFAGIEPLWKKVPADYPIELLLGEPLRQLYPAPFAGELLRYAKPRSVDPRLLLAIMRQESRFRPDARSAAAARGLMQFIHPASQKIASELGWDGLDDQELYSPGAALLFGSQYIADLNALFPGQPEAVVAAYNGGEDNVKRWLVRSRSSEPDRYVPELVYGQTKDYVQRVMTNYRMYQLIYDEELKPR